MNPWSLTVNLADVGWNKRSKRSAYTRGQSIWMLQIWGQYNHTNWDDVLAADSLKPTSYKPTPREFESLLCFTHRLPDGVLSGSMCVKMIMVMWIIHVGDLEEHVIRVLQIRHYITIGSILCEMPYKAECAADCSGDRRTHSFTLIC